MSLEWLIIYAFFLGFGLWLLFSSYQSNASQLTDPQPGDGKKSCIFCGNKQMTGEHVFPDWLKKVVPRSGDKKGFTNIRYVLADKIGGSAYRSSQTYKGHPGSTKLRIVCKDCNTKWMSTLQILTKPLLIPLILRENCTLSVAQQSIINKWAIMTTIVSEYLNQPPYAFSISNRKYFYKNKKLMSGWQVWIGKNSTKNKLNIFWLPMTYQKKSGEEIIPMESNYIERGLVAGIMIEGAFILVAKLDLLSRLVELPKELTNKLILTNPTNSLTIDTNSLEGVTNDDIDNIMGYFSGLLV